MIRFRTLIYVGIAALALVAIVALSNSGHADYGEVSLVESELAPFDFIVATSTAPDFVQCVAPPVPRAQDDWHAVAYAVHSQPGTKWRFSVDAYRLIDPHIALA